MDQGRRAIQESAGFPPSALHTALVIVGTRIERILPARVLDQRETWCTAARPNSLSITHVKTALGLVARGLCPPVQAAPRLSAKARCIAAPSGYLRSHRIWTYPKGGPRVGQRIGNLWIPEVERKPKERDPGSKPLLELAPVVSQADLLRLGVLRFFLRSPSPHITREAWQCPRCGKNRARLYWLPDAPLGRRPDETGI